MKRDPAPTTSVEGPGADYVAQMQDAVTGVLDQIPDVGPYVEALLAHWIWVGATIDAATGERTELNDLARRLHQTTQDYVDLKDEIERLRLALGARNTEAELIWIEENERLRAALRHQIGGCCFCPACDATYALIDGGDEG